MSDHPVRHFLIALALLVVLGIADFLISSEFSFSVLYLVPVAWAAWYVSKGAGLAMAGLGAVAWYFAEDASTPIPLTGQILFWQSFSRCGYSLIAALLISHIRLLTTNLDRMVRFRTAALREEITRRKELEREAAEISQREQERLAEELHDDLAAYLAGVSFRAKALAETLAGEGSCGLSDAGNLVELVDRATDQVRGLARSLSPLDANASDLGLVLSGLAKEAETVFQITCTMEMPDRVPDLTPDQCAQLYHIAREAVRNAIRHSKAELVEISVLLRENYLQLRVTSDGKPWVSPSTASTGLGLKIMRHRTERLEGTLSIEPLAQGGAVVLCKIPLVPLTQPG